MSTITLASSFDTSSFRLPAVADPVPVTTATSYEYKNSAGFYVVVTGAGLTYSGSPPSPNGGTFTKIEVYSDAAHTTLVATLDTSANPLSAAGLVFGIGTISNDTMTGSAGDDTLYADQGNDQLSGGGGNDTYVVDTGDTVTENADEGFDTIASSAISIDLANYANTEGVILFGSTASLNATGTSGANTLSGEQNSKENVLTGLEGNDRYIVGTGDTIVEAAGAGGGSDSVESSTISLDLETFANVERAILTGSTAINALGTSGADVLSGIDNSAANILTGRGGDDAYIVGTGDTIVEAAGAAGGTDSVQSSTISLDLETFANVERAILTGSTAINALGTSGADVLSGIDNSAANILSGRGGDDAYIVGTGDTIVEAAGAAGGTDSVQSSTISLDLETFANVENAVLTGSTAINAFGTNGGDTLSGIENSAANTLTGRAGNDLYYVGAGDKIVEAAGAGTGTDMVASNTRNLSLADFANVENIYLYGALTLTATGNTGANYIDGSQNSAANKLTGLGGNDSYVIGAGDTIIEAANGGLDSVTSSTININMANFANVETAVVEGALALSITGTSAANTLVGAQSTAANTLTGLGGDDTYIIGSNDKIAEAAGAAGGVDTAASSIANVNLQAHRNVENGYLYGTLALSLTGSSGDNQLDGSQNSAANLLSGLTGNDTYIVGLGDKISETGSGGTDTVISNSINIDMSKYANVERASVSGSSALKITGTNGANAMFGVDSTASNVLTGLAGNDTYYVDGKDKVVESAASSGGIDNVGSSVASINLANYANVENAFLYGGTALNLAGSAKDNMLQGNDAANTISGLAGNDILYGLGGKDTLTGGLGQDGFVFNSAYSSANIDTITDFKAADDTIYLENAIFKAISGVNTLTSAQFHIGAAAHDANDRIIYNAANGALFYDSNGNAAGGATQIAKLSANLALTNFDFFVI